MSIKLDLPARETLIARMQAYAYSNVIGGNMHKATSLAISVLASFDYIMGEKPCENPGFWANRYFERFVQDCEKLN